MRFLKIQGLKLEHRTAFGQKISEFFLPYRALYSRCFHGVVLRSERSEISLSCPDTYRVLTADDRELWAGGQANCRISFEWKTPPKGLKVIFPNGHFLEIAEKTQPRLVFIFQSLQPLTLILGALFLHIFLIGWMGTQYSPARLKSRPEELLDISKIQVSLSHDISSFDIASSAAHSSRTLLDSWNVGRPISNANQVLKPTAFEKAFNKTSAKHKSDKLSWNFQESEHETKLNLSEAQIAKALEPIRPKLKDCYDEILIRDPQLEGSPELMIHVNDLGFVHALDIVRLKAKTESLRQLTTCFLQAYRQASLPKKPNRNFVVTHTLVLSR